MLSGGGERTMNVEELDGDWIWRYGGELSKGKTNGKRGEIKIF